MSGTLRSGPALLFHPPLTPRGRKHVRTSPISDYVFPPPNRPRTVTAQTATPLPIPIPIASRRSNQFSPPDSALSPTLFDYYHASLIDVNTQNDYAPPRGQPSPDLDHQHQPFFSEQEPDLPFSFDRPLESTSDSVSVSDESLGSAGHSVPSQFDPNLRRRSSLAPSMDANMNMVFSIPESTATWAYTAGWNGAGIKEEVNPTELDVRDLPFGTPSPAAAGTHSARATSRANSPWFKETKSSLSLASVEKTYVLASPQISSAGAGDRRSTMSLPFLDSQSSPPPLNASRRLSLPVLQIQTQKVTSAVSRTSSSASLYQDQSSTMSRQACRPSPLSIDTDGGRAEGSLSAWMSPAMKADPHQHSHNTESIARPSQSPLASRRFLSPSTPSPSPLLNNNARDQQYTKDRRRSACLFLPLPLHYRPTSPPPPSAITSSPVASRRSSDEVPSLKPHRPSLSPSRSPAPATSSSSASSSSPRRISRIEIHYNPDSPTAVPCKRLILSLRRQSLDPSSSTIPIVSAILTDDEAVKPKVKITFLGSGDRAPKEFDPTGLSIDQMLDRIRRATGHGTICR